jgi:hypothetical protein
VTPKYDIERPSDFNELLCVLVLCDLRKGKDRLFCGELSIIHAWIIRYGDYLCTYRKVLITNVEGGK